MPYCIGITALLAILYVLSRTEAGIRDCYTMEDFDIGAYRDQQLAASPPHIIECAAAGEGGSQEKCHLPRPLRYSALGQKGITLWMTGLSGSGKSTIAAALEEKLVLEYGKSVYRLDGDNIRTGLNRDLGFSDADRAESVRRVGELSTLFNDAGVITLVGLVSPFRADRDAVRRRHEDMGLKFMEVLMDVPLDVVKKRDPKGLYAKVDKGEIKGFTGVDAPYEPPLDAELYLKNYEMTIEESVNVMLRLLQREGVLEGPEPPVKGLPSPVRSLHFSQPQTLHPNPNAIIRNLKISGWRRDRGPARAGARAAGAAPRGGVAAEGAAHGHRPELAADRRRGLGGAAQGLHARGHAAADAALQLHPR